MLRAWPEKLVVYAGIYQYSCRVAGIRNMVGLGHITLLQLDQQ